MFWSGGCFLELVQTTGLTATLTAFIKCAIVSSQKYSQKLSTTSGCESTTYGCKSSLCQNWKILDAGSRLIRVPVDY
nr:MAG TPA_asm: hypothetical protein [Caudoviricetes sp.]